MSAGKSTSAGASRVWVITVAAAVVGVALLLIPPRYSSEATDTAFWCGSPLFFDEDSVSRKLQDDGKGREIAGGYADECHERVTKRVTYAVLVGLVGIGTLGVAARRQR